MKKNMAVLLGYQYFATKNSPGESGVMPLGTLGWCPDDLKEFFIP